MRFYYERAINICAYAKEGVVNAKEELRQKEVLYKMKIGNIMAKLK